MRRRAHGCPEQVDAPVLDQVRERLQRVAVREPVEAVRGHAEELHGRARGVDELHAVESELAVGGCEVSRVDLIERR